MKLPTLYLCGPMSGLPDYNVPAFTHAAATLRYWGYTVINPAENGLPHDAPWADHMRRDIAALAQCRAVAVLPGTDRSRGAQLELHIATALGMPVANVATWAQVSADERPDWPYPPHPSQPHGAAA